MVRAWALDKKTKNKKQPGFRSGSVTLGKFLNLSVLLSVKIVTT